MRRLLLLTTVALVLGLIGSVAVVAQDVVTVTWWTETDGIPPNVQEAFIEPFEAAHPGIRIELIGQESLNDVLRTAIQAGEAPDILQTPGASFIAETINAGVVEPLDDYAAQYGWQDKLLGWAYDSGVLGGRLYSIPLTYESMILLYNKSLFEEQGWSVPTNIDELNAVAEAAVAAGIHPFAYGNVGWQPTNEHLMGIYLNNYAGPENVYKALIGEKSWTDPEFVGATDLLRQHIADNGWFSGGLENYFATGWDDFWAELSSGQAAMMMIGTWAFRGANDFFDEAGAEWDWAPLPTLSDMAGEYNYELATGSTLSINAASSRKDEAALVLDFLLSDPERVLELASSVGFGEWMVPVHIDESDFPEGTDERFVRFFSDFAEVTGEGRIGYTTWTFWPAGPNVQLWQAVENVWYGDLSVEDYLAEQQAQWDAARARGEVLPVPAPAM
jgi:raffinose/stachyose/melibiose transport system substrate-binding protein